MQQKIKIVYLYAEIMGYNVAVFKEYVSKFNAEVHVISWDKQKKTPYIAPSIDGVYYYGKSSFNEQTIVSFVENLEPSLIVTSGWMDNFYINACKRLRRLNIPILAVSDTQFYGTIKQRLGIYYFKLFYKKAFSHLWVAGPYQYEYAKRLGYKNEEIVFNFLSADNDLFKTFYKRTFERKIEKYPKQFLFAGRFAPEKGLHLLVEAWNAIEDKKGWKLTVVGNGIMKQNLLNNPNIEILDFLQPENFQNIIQNTGCFILPSIKEPWALVLQEFALAGLPVIASDTCGAIPYFLIHNYNGLVFKNKDAKSLQAALEYFIKLPEDVLIQMAKKSHALGKRITPEIVAFNSLSIL